MSVDDTNPLYVAILEPDEVRKDVLLSSKDVLTLLRSFEKFKSLQEHKSARLSELRKVTAELVVLNKKLKLILPRAPLQRSSEVKFAPISSARFDSPLVTHDNDALDYLEDELKKIEHELQALG